MASGNKVKTCHVRGCYASSLNYPPPVFFPFPQLYQITFEDWFKFANPAVHQARWICEKHFDKSQYEDIHRGKLHRNAVPTLYPGLPTPKDAGPKKRVKAPKTKKSKTDKEPQENTVSGTNRTQILSKSVPKTFGIGQYIPPKLPPTAQNRNSHGPVAGFDQHHDDGFKVPQSAKSPVIFRTADGFIIPKPRQKAPPNFTQTLGKYEVSSHPDETEPPPKVQRLSQSTDSFDEIDVNNMDFFKKLSESLPHELLISTKFKQTLEELEESSSKKEPSAKTAPNPIGLTSLQTSLFQDTPQLPNHPAKSTTLVIKPSSRKIDLNIDKSSFQTALKAKPKIITVKPRAQSGNQIGLKPRKNRQYGSKKIEKPAFPKILYPTPKVQPSAESPASECALNVGSAKLLKVDPKSVPEFVKKVVQNNITGGLNPDEKRLVKVDPKSVPESVKMVFQSKGNREVQDPNSKHSTGENTMRGDVGKSISSMKDDVTFLKSAGNNVQSTKVQEKTVLRSVLGDILARNPSVACDKAKLVKIDPKTIPENVTIDKNSIDLESTVVLREETDDGDFDEVCDDCADHDDDCVESVANPADDSMKSHVKLKLGEKTARQSAEHQSLPCSRQGNDDDDVIFLGSVPSSSRASSSGSIPKPLETQKTPKIVKVAPKTLLTENTSKCADVPQPSTSCDGKMAKTATTAQKNVDVVPPNSVQIHPAIQTVTSSMTALKNPPPLVIRSNPAIQTVTSVMTAVKDPPPLAIRSTAIGPHNKGALVKTATTGQKNTDVVLPNSVQIHPAIQTSLMATAPENPPPLAIRLDPAIQNVTSSMETSLKNPPPLAIRPTAFGPRDKVALVKVDVNSVPEYIKRMVEGIKNKCPVPTKEVSDPKKEIPAEIPHNIEHSYARHYFEPDRKAVESLLSLQHAKRIIYSKLDNSRANDVTVVKYAASSPQVHKSSGVIPVNPSSDNEYLNTAEFCETRLNESGKSGHNIKQPKLMIDGSAIREQGARPRILKKSKPHIATIIGQFLTSNADVQIAEKSSDPPSQLRKTLDSGQSSRDVEVITMKHMTNCRVKVVDVLKQKRIVDKYLSNSKKDGKRAETASKRKHQCDDKISHLRTIDLTNDPSEPVVVTRKRRKKMNIEETRLSELSTKDFEPQIKIAASYQQLNLVKLYGGFMLLQHTAKLNEYYSIADMSRELFTGVTLVESSLDPLFRPAFLYTSSRMSLDADDDAIVFINAKLVSKLRDSIRVLRSSLGCILKPLVGTEIESMDRKQYQDLALATSCVSSQVERLEATFRSINSKNPISPEELKNKAIKYFPCIQILISRVKKRFPLNKPLVVRPENLFSTKFLLASPQEQAQQTILVPHAPPDVFSKKSLLASSQKPGQKTGPFEPTDAFGKKSILASLLEQVQDTESLVPPEAAAQSVVFVTLVREGKKTAPSYMVIVQLCYEPSSTAKSNDSQKSPVTEPDSNAEITAKSANLSSPDVSVGNCSVPSVKQPTVSSSLSLIDGTSTTKPTDGDSPTIQLTPKLEGAMKSSSDELLASDAGKAPVTAVPQENEIETKSLTTATAENRLTGSDGPNLTSKTADSNQGNAVNVQQAATPNTLLAAKDYSRIDATRLFGGFAMIEHAINNIKIRGVTASSLSILKLGSVFLGSFPNNNVALMKITDFFDPDRSFLSQEEMAKNMDSLVFIEYTDVAKVIVGLMRIKSILKRMTTNLEKKKTSVASNIMSTLQSTLLDVRAVVFKVKDQIPAVFKLNKAVFPEELVGRPVTVRIIIPEQPNRVQRLDVGLQAILLAFSWLHLVNVNQDKLSKALVNLLTQCNRKISWGTDSSKITPVLNMWRAADRKLNRDMKTLLDRNSLRVGVNKAEITKGNPNSCASREQRNPSVTENSANARTSSESSVVNESKGIHAAEISSESSIPVESAGVATPKHPSETQNSSMDSKSAESSVVNESKGIHAAEISSESSIPMESAGVASPTYPTETENSFKASKSSESSVVNKAKGIHAAGISSESSIPAEPSGVTAQENPSEIERPFIAESSCEASDKNDAKAFDPADIASESSIPGEPSGVINPTNSSISSSKVSIANDSQATHPVAASSEFMPPQPSGSEDSSETHESSASCVSTTDHVHSADTSPESSIADNPSGAIPRENLCQVADSSTAIQSPGISTDSSSPVDIS